MSLLDTVKPDWYGNANSLGEKHTALVARWKGHGTLGLYSRETVESLLSQRRKEALLEAVEVCKTIANDAEDCGATPEMLEIVYAVEDELRRMAEGENK